MAGRRKDSDELDDQMMAAMPEMLVPRNRSARRFAAAGGDPDDEPRGPEYFSVKSVQVTDPRKQGDGLAAYTIYTVCSTVQTTADGRIEKFNVTRRYRDFLWLHISLRSSFPGCITPPIPDKNYLTRFTSKQIQVRQRGLDAFLNRVANHAILSQSDEFEEFLMLSEEKFSELRDFGGPANAAIVEESKKSAASSAAASASWVFGLISETITSQFKGQYNYEKTEQDLKFDDLSNSNRELVKLLNSVVKKTTDLRRTGKELASAWFEMGMAMTQLGQVEAKESSEEVGDVLKKFGQGADRISVLTTRKLDSDEEDFENPFEDLARTAQAVQDMLDSRASYLNKYIQSLQNFETVKKSKPKSGQDHQGVIHEAKSQVDERKAFLDGISVSALDEIQKFTKEKDEVLKKLTLAHLRVQIDYATKTQELWKEILDEYEEIPDLNG
eukprot:TRINITY_DN4898_c0_g1_i1.p1 TRINITY_DN4898_c0_g1~~TRINITY_DN4898_c0_g1_i1.p1  ORF type:complete len:442 (+),score=132.75 TRINITY_DN4898_c0_g1_i1:98-1423(+)